MKISALKTMIMVSFSATLFAGTPTKNQVLTDLKKAPTVNQQLEKFKTKSISKIEKLTFVEDYNGMGDAFSKAYSKRWRSPLPYDVIKFYVKGNTPKDGEGQYYELSFTITYQRFHIVNDVVIANPEWEFQDVFVSLDKSHYKKRVLGVKKATELFTEKFLANEVDIPAPTNNNEIIYIGEPQLSRRYTAGVEERNMGGFYYFVGVPIEIAEISFKDESSISALYRDTVAFRVKYNYEGKGELQIKEDGYGESGFNTTEKRFQKPDAASFLTSNYKRYSKHGFDEVYLKKEEIPLVPGSYADEIAKTKVFKKLLMDVLSTGTELNHPERLKQHMKASDYEAFIDDVKKLKDDKKEIESAEISKEGQISVNLIGTSFRNRSYKRNDNVSVQSDREGDKVWFEIVL